MEDFVDNVSKNVLCPTNKNSHTIAERKLYLDLLRIIAICAVVMIHVSASYVVNPNNLLSFTIGNICDSFSRIGVPLFLMISGSLVLDENKEFNCRKRIFSILIPWCVWSFLYAFRFTIVIPISQGKSFNVVSFFIYFITGHYHLWYMWAIIGLYLISPILRKFVKKENKQIVAYFIVLSLIFQFSKPIITLLFETVIRSGNLEYAHTYISKNLNLDFFGGLTTYFLAGWFLSNINLKKSTEIFLYVIGLCSLICIIVVTQIFPNKYSLTYSNTGLFVLFYSIAIFLLVKNLCSNKRSENRFIIGCSNLSFGVYLIHVFILTMVEQILPVNSLFIPLIFLATLTISYIIIYAISKIPIAKKTVRG